MTSVMSAHFLRFDAVVLRVLVEVTGHGAVGVESGLVGIRDRGRGGRLGEVDAAEGADATCRDGAEHSEAGATEHGQRDQRPQDGEETQEEQDGAADRDDEPALDAGDGDQSDVLGEGADGEAVEDRGQ
jgi:hypothetical protein